MAKFITFEGCDGVGKSKQVKMLSEYLNSIGVKHIVTREPGGTEISESIRAIILNGKFKEMGDECEALLYAAARAQHLKDTIIPALDAGIMVICDRYVDSSLAYQGYARGLGYDYVEKINAFAYAHMPDATVFLDLEPEAAFKRKGGDDKNDRLEASGLNFHKRVYEGYLELVKTTPRIIDIDCSGEKHITHQKIIDALKTRGVI